MENKNIIIIETSLSRILISIIKNKKVFSNCLNSPKSIEQDLNLLIDKLMKKANLNFREINLILVSLGPGSFTGIRIGISAAKALSLCTGAKIIGYSNFESIYSQFLTKEKQIKIKKVEVLIKGPGNEYFRKIFTSDKVGKKDYLITHPDLIKKKISDDLLLIGNFRNTFKIKNYFFCLPNKKGYLTLASKLTENLHNYKNEEPIPIYGKAHYAYKK
ncbi:tRNA (adenosine(37)-N6)-threonylcarbamoyltransferase complex dimerization subunit type 1 TsaB [Alphaproteobacteria bacterium]|jgi:tRNA threonylcarbamoyladenosine biosynthesis protein TsaB|nr:tRNA (adenosine(37)-N6)-threonylcarbamoyltransferase complex dimerization subunit type 1 TsaB [Alphaproteobacteria bacterium]